MRISKGENSAAGENFWPKYLAESRNPPLFPAKMTRRGGFLDPVGTDHLGFGFCVFVCLFFAG